MGKKELWKNISELGTEYKEYSDYYVSNSGKIWSEKTKKLLTPIKVSGYLYVDLYNRNHERQRYKIHRLVALAFVFNDNPQVKTHVNHKDEDKSHNWDTNLEWCTPKYNDNYGTRNKRISKKMSGENNPMYGKTGTMSPRHGLHLLIGENNPMYGKRGGQHPASKAIVQLTLDKKYVTSYESVSATAKKGFNPKIVSECLRNRQSTHKGYCWMYLEDYEKKVGKTNEGCS